MPLIDFCRLLSKTYFAQMELKNNAKIDLYALAKMMNGKYKIEYDERFNYNKVYIKGYCEGTITLGITGKGKIWAFTAHNYSEKAMSKILNAFAKTLENTVVKNHSRRASKPK